MDTTINRPQNRRKLYLFTTLAVLALAFFGGWHMSGSPSTRVERDRLTISTVRQDRFYEYINLDGRIEPAAIYLIDSKVAGNVDRIYVSAGQEVSVGDTLLKLSNADLELDVMQRESQLIEQLNNQRQTRLLLDQNDFTRREQLVEIDYQLVLQEKQSSRDRELLAGGVIAAADYEPSDNRYRYYQRRRNLLAASFRADSLARSRQLVQLDASESRILANLERVRTILDRLYVRAATSGRLSDFTLRDGQTVASGQRIGEIYSLDDPLLVAEVDEFYLNKISVGQRGLLSDRSDSTEIRVEKIYPTVNAGRFRIEARLVGQEGQAPNFVRGQSLRFRLLFGPAASSVVLATGGFYGSTGGHWVYRLEEDGARRTPIRLGRANPNYYEVLEGLEPGDRVIVSGYEDFDEYPTITLN